MKSFATSIIAIVAFASTSLAAPSARDVPGNVKLCNSSHWFDCEDHFFDMSNNDNCNALPQRFADHLGSIGPDRGALCRIYTDSSCAEKYQLAMPKYPGIDNLYNFQGKDVGHQVKFIRCNSCSGCT